MRQKLHQWWPQKISDRSNKKCRSLNWMVEYEGKDDGWPENGSQCRMIAKCEKGWKESGRYHKMGQRMDLSAK